MEKTIAKIKTLKSISPDAGFASMSRSVILASAREEYLPKTGKSFFYELGVSLGVMATAITVAVLLGGVKTNDTTLVAANINAIQDEAITVGNDIDITLKEINSFNQSDKKTALALNEAAGNGPSHLNDAILSSEIKSLNLMSAPEESVTDLLDQAIF